MTNGGEKPKTVLGLEENIEGALAYLFGLVSGLILFIVEKDNRFIKFHALQSILFSIAYYVLMAVLLMIPILGWIMAFLLALAGFGFWLFLMYKAYSGEMFKIPLIGDFTEQQLR